RARGHLGAPRRRHRGLGGARRGARRVPPGRAGGPGHAPPQRRDPHRGADRHDEHAHGRLLGRRARRRAGPPPPNRRPPPTPSPPVFSGKIGASYPALIHPLFQELLEAHEPPRGYARDGGWDWEAVVKAVQDNHGSVQGLDFIPEAVRRVLICAHDITPTDHVKMQATVQRAFDGGAKVANSISKTINLPNAATVDDVFDAYRLAFEAGCKGITV